MERRGATRRVPSLDEPLSQVRLRAGCALSVVNISNAGLLVEGPARLLPGTHVDLHVMTNEGRVLIRSRVERAYVRAITPDAVLYQGALAFVRAIDASALGYPVPHTSEGMQCSGAGVTPTTATDASSEIDSGSLQADNRITAEMASRLSAREDHPLPHGGSLDVVARR